MVDVNFTDLLSKGYVVINSFLNNDELDILKLDYNQQRPTDNKNYNYRNVDQKCKAIFDHKLLEVINCIEKQNILNVNQLKKSGDYISTDVIKFNWHQDHESWYVLQHHYHYLNFYIPVIKPDPNLSGLSIVPFDVLENLIPDYIDKIKNNGATRYRPNDNITHVINEDVGYEYTLPINLDTISISPTLNPGDLLLLRGDVIHKTQDTLTSRVSVSFRAFNGNSKINKHRMLSGCDTKQTFIKNNQPLYTWILNQFDKHKVDEITPLELFGK